VGELDDAAEVSMVRPFFKLSVLRLPMADPQPFTFSSTLDEPEAGAVGC
jgi:hypothetical protein